MKLRYMMEMLKVRWPWANAASDAARPRENWLSSTSDNGVSIVSHIHQQHCVITEAGVHCGTTVMVDLGEHRA